MMTPSSVLADRDHVLLDFDGPICSVFGNLTERTVADRLKLLLSPGLPRAVRGSGDPFEVLRYAVSCGPNTATVVETQLRRLELEAVATAPSTAGAVAAMESLHARGYSITVVSNNSADAVRAYLTIHGPGEFVLRISARTGPEPGGLMPDPLPIDRAIRGLGTTARRCVLIGFSPAAIAAGQAAGVPVIGHADGRRARAAHKPDAVISDLTELTGPPVTP